MKSTYPLAGHDVHRIGFGAMQLPGPGVMGPPRDHDQAIAVLRRAVELGVDHIDTAQFYGPDVSNELIREALHPYGDDLVLVSKVGARRDTTGAWLPALEPAQLKEDVEQNLRTLGAEQLGAVNLRLHEDDGSVQDAEPQDELAAQLEAMKQLRDEGKIAGIGISTATLDQVRTAHESVGLVCVQNAFSYVDQSDAGVLDYCTEQGIAYVPYFPLGSAFPHLPKVTDDEQVKAVAQRLGVTPAQVGLAWLLRRAANVLLIPGTSSVAHLEDNIATGDVELAAGDLAG
ncbi:oxidoreductase [Allobranchiibius sp. CTAmp26]|nr:oxidoreductase [Allobranchiibius sp. CTAmp26]